MTRNDMGREMARSAKRSERARRLRSIRNGKICDIVFNACVIGVLAVTAAFLVAIYIHTQTHAAQNERAAYLEGRYDLDHETAMQCAAAELAKEVR